MDPKQSGGASAPNYFTLRLLDVPVEKLEAVTALVFDAGALGTEEVLRFTQPDLQYDPVQVPADTTDLRVYFGEAPNTEFLQELRRVSAADLTVEECESKDWLAEWKKGFQAFSLVGETWVVPTWCEVPAAAKSVIRMDPGMAFGTGTHETTQLAAELIARWSARQATSKSGSLLDVGMGTGILGILAWQLGFSPVRGIDIDPEARRVARENIAANRAACEITDENVDQVQGEWNWVVANIIDGVLIKLQADLKRLVAPKGFLVLSGILVEREGLFNREFVVPGFELLERVKKNEWIALIYRRE